MNIDDRIALPPRPELRCKKQPAPDIRARFQYHGDIIHRIRRYPARKLLQCAYPRGAKAACTSTAKNNDSQLLIIDMENRL